MHVSATCFLFPVLEPCKVNFTLIFSFFFKFLFALYFMSRILYQVAFGNMTLSSLLCFYIYYLITPNSHLLSNNLVFQYSIMLALCLNAILNMKNFDECFQMHCK